MHALLEPETVSNSCASWTEVQGKTGSMLCFSMVIKKCNKSSICAVEDSTPGLPFRVAGTKGERLPTLYPEHLARRRRRVPGTTLGTVSPTALAHHSSHACLKPLCHSGQRASASGLAQGHTSGARAPPTRSLLKGPGVSHMVSRAPC